MKMREIIAMLRREKDFCEELLELLHDEPTSIISFTLQVNDLAGAISALDTGGWPGNERPKDACQKLHSTIQRMEGVVDSIGDDLGNIDRLREHIARLKKAHQTLAEC